MFGQEHSQSHLWQAPESYTIAPPQNYNDAMRSVQDLPACFQGVYHGCFRYFNSIQSECFPELVHSDNSMIITAPTGGGKTVILELAILRLLSRNIARNGEYCHRPGALKAIYLAPAKALVQEKVREWTEKFGRSLGLKIKEVTGDTDQDELAGIDATDIICTTPEKFDAMTRRSRERGGMRFFNEVALLLIDEVHLLSENRGSTLEAGVVSRIKLVASKPELAGYPIASLRYVAVSATVPNARDLAEWLGAPLQGIKIFGDEMRPVKLHTVVSGYAKTGNDFLFDRRLTDYVFPVLQEYSRGKPSLVFCASRAGVVSTGLHVVREAVRAAAGARPSILLRDPAHHARLTHAASSLQDASLRECIIGGVGFHHAAMEPADRATVEALFRATDLLVLCTTSTLAVGVNLPAFLVVIKGTTRYAGAEASDPGGYQEYERSTLLQMTGRAGRPQFDTEGCAVIMTEKGNVGRYQQLLNSSEPVESTLHEALPEFLNAEIALGTVPDITTAISWLRSTYFYVRVRRAPSNYRVPPAAARDPAELERWLKESLVLTTVRELARHGLVQTDEDGFSLQALKPGIIMAEHYVKLPTMVELCGCPASAGIPELLWVIARSSELSGIKLRRSEKKVLNSINQSESMKYHVMNPAKPEKINYALADAPSEKMEYSMKRDAEQAVSVGARLAAAMVDFFIHKERASETFNALLLQKSLKQNMWTGSGTETRQLAGVGAVTADRLAGAGIQTLRQLAAADPRRLEVMAQRAYPWGNQIQDALRQCMPSEVQLTCTPMAWAPGGLVDVQVTLTRSTADAGDGAAAAASVQAQSSRAKSRSPARLLVGSLHDNALLGCRALCLDSFPSPMVFTVRTRTSAGRGALQIVASVVHKRLIGVDVAVKTVVPHNAPLNGEPMPVPAPDPRAPTLIPAAAQTIAPVLDTPLEEEKRPPAALNTAPKPKAKPKATPQHKAKTPSTQTKREPEGTVAAKFMQKKLQEMTSFVSPPPQQQSQVQQHKETLASTPAGTAPPSMISPLPLWKPVPVAERHSVGHPVRSTLHMTRKSTEAHASRQYHQTQQAQHVRPTLPGLSRAPSFAQFAFGTRGRTGNEPSSALGGENKGPPPSPAGGVQMPESISQRQAPLTCITQQPLAPTNASPTGPPKGAVAKRLRVHGGAGLSWLTAKYQADATTENKSERGLVAPARGQCEVGERGHAPEHTLESTALDISMSNALGFL